MAALSRKKLINDFDSDGFVHLHGLFPKELIQAKLQLLGRTASFCLQQLRTPNFQSNYEDHPSYSEVCEILVKLQKVASRDRYIGFMKAAALSVQTRKIFSADQLLNVISTVLGHDNISQIGNPVLHVVGDNLSIDKSPLNSPYHQDWPSLQTSKKTIIAWIPLGETPADQGLKIKRGSHKNGIIQPTRLSNVYEICDAEHSKFKTLTMNMKMGDCLLMDSFVVHGSDHFEGARLSLSGRFENLLCEDWSQRNYESTHRYFLERPNELKII